MKSSKKKKYFDMKETTSQLKITVMKARLPLASFHLH